MPNWLDTASAAERLGVTPTRVRQLIATGKIDGTSVGSRWFVDSASIQDRLNGSKDKPYSERTAWATLWELSGLPNPVTLSRSEMERIRQRLAMPPAHWVPLLRRRALVRRYRCPRSQFPTLLATEGVVVSGISATNHHRIDLISLGQADIYVRNDAALDRLIRNYPLRPDADDSNLVVRTPSRWLFDSHQYAPKSVVAVDLVDSGDPRSASTGLDVLGQLAGAVAAR